MCRGREHGVALTAGVKGVGEGAVVNCVKE